jgi:thiol-disulfide isomerase/thioredoxin
MDKFWFPNQEKRMIRYLSGAVLLLAMVLPFRLYAEDEGGPYVKDPDAIAILQRADAAIREVPGLSFTSDYLGSFTARGRVSAEVLLRRDDGADEVMGTASYTVKADVTAVETPYAVSGAPGMEHLPQRYTLIDNPAGASLIDRNDRVVRVATGTDRQVLNSSAISSAILPQYLRADPLKMEMEDSIGAAYLGTQVVGGVETDVVWLKFEETSGYGEQLLYFGVDDHLIRKATLTSPRVVIRPRSEDRPEATFPTMHFDMALSDLSVLPTIDDERFTVDTDGFRQVRLSPPTIGQPGPDWTLQTGAGGTVSSTDLRGEVAYLFFWASWCPTCHTYLPEVQKIHDDYEDVRVLAVNAYDRDDALRYIRGINYTFEVALRGDALLGSEFQFVGVPALVILDRNGVIRHRELAPRVDQAEEIQSLIRELVNEG